MVGWHRDWSSVSDFIWITEEDVNDFLQAFSERYVAAGDGAMDWTKSVGDPSAGRGKFIFDSIWVRKIQEWIETTAVEGGWVVSHENGIRRDPATHWTPAYESDGPYGDWYGSRTQLFEAAGLTHTDWRRYTVHPSEGGTVKYGKAETGDILGAWLLADLQAILNVLVWRARKTPGDGAEWTADGETNHYHGDSSCQETWEAAIAAAKADYGAEGSVNGSPGAWTGGWKHYCGALQGSGYDAWTSRKYAYLEFWEPAYGCERAIGVDFYALMHKKDVWNSQGDPCSWPDYLCHWYAETLPAADSGGRISSQSYGDASKPPNWGGEPDLEGYDYGYDGGYGVVLVRYDVAGGFDYF